MRNPRAFLFIPAAGEPQNRLQPDAAFGQMLSHVPESKQGYAQTQGPVHLPCLEQPVKREREILDLGVALHQPTATILWTQVRIALFREDETVRGMSATGRCLL